VSTWFSNLLRKIVFAFEFVYAATGIHEFLLTREERMAVGANLYAESLLDGSGFKLVAASAGNFYDVVVRMNTLLHLFAPLFRPESFAETEL
jgi:hypothetical protein